ncbi:MAG: drug/metabolite transporter (DMT)-like permease [Candidatus Azotimanducaceae bacterium]|jgi:drug/metabolite transporter (DMT)-like permease
MKRAASPLTGVLLMAAGAALAPGIDVFAKSVPHEIPVAQVTAARFIVQSSLLLPIAAFLAVLHLPSHQEIGLHLVRATLIMVATGLFFTALRAMPIADAIAVFFVEPFMLTLLGAWILKETVGPRRIIACVIGFIGALFVIQPSFADTGPVALLPLGTAACFAIYMVLTRQMAQEMHPLAMQSYTALAAVALSVPILFMADGSGIAGLDPAWPSTFAILMMIGVGVMATIAHLLISFAMAYAPASTLAPLQFLEIVAATILGFMIFDDIPTPTTMFGVTIIIASGLYVLARERKNNVASGPNLDAI